MKMIKLDSPLIVQILRHKDESLGKYMYTTHLIFVTDRAKREATQIKTDIYTGVLATAITTTLRGISPIFDRIYPLVELYDADTDELITSYDLNDTTVINSLRPMSSNLSPTVH